MADDRPIPDPQDPPEPPPGEVADGTPGEDDWLGSLWVEEFYPKYTERTEDGAHEVGDNKGFYVPRGKRLWSLNKCATMMWGLLTISETVATRTDPIDALSFMTEEWSEEDYGFDRPMTLHLARAVIKHATQDAHKEWCTYHLGHMVCGADGFDRLEFCYANDLTGDYMDPGYGQVQGKIPNEPPPPGVPIDQGSIVSTGERFDFIIDPLTDERYVEEGEEYMVSSMHLPSYYVGWVMDRAVFCSIAT